MYFLSPNGLAAIQNQGMKGITANAGARNLALEHPLAGIIAIVLITVGWSLHKKQQTDKRAFGKIALFYGLGFAVLMAALPLKQWLGLQ